MAHRIRLRDGWETAFAEGVTRHSRKFGRPRTLDANERVWLVCEETPANAELRLNGHSIGRMEAVRGSFAIDITELLLPRNKLDICFPGEASLGPVFIEIRTETETLP